jgi:short-subunit dehydrogenase
MQISGSSVLLTGATGGIGQASARELAGRGAQLTLSGRQTDVLEALAEELGARSLTVDLSKAREVDRLIAEAGDVDILVANAGLPGTGLLESYSVRELDRVLDVNLRAPIVLARGLSEAMIKRRRGQLVFVSSLAGKAATTAKSSLYNATKFGLRGFAHGLRAELRASGVGVSVVCPGFIRDAGMFAKSGTRLPSGIGTRSPEDVARAIVQAIVENRAEIDVAPLSLRLGSAFAGLAPETAATVTRVSGGEQIADDLAAGQREMR